MSKILLVEDNPDAVKRIIRYINKIFAELDVVSFPEAGDALQYAKANDISLFILDIQLEDYKGRTSIELQTVFEKVDPTNRTVVSLYSLYYNSAGAPRTASPAFALSVLP